MGMVLGRITVETPKYEVVRVFEGYEIRRYAPTVAAEVTYDPAQDFGGDRDGGFRVLADYIGALGNPQNASPEKIDMTAPVITKTAQPSYGEKIDMTAPVLTKVAQPSSGEKIDMTAPVVTKSGSGGDGRVTMQFILPSKYTRAEEAPRPTDARVKIREEGEKKYAAVRFAGMANKEAVSEQVAMLRKNLERDGQKAAGDFILARYNPPWTIAAFRTNEVLIPVD